MLRKLKPIALMWAISLPLLQAQVQKGTLTISGINQNTIGLNSQSVGSSSWLMFDLYYNVSDQLALGGRNTISLGDFTAFGLLPGVRYYLRKPAKAVKFYVQGETGFLINLQDINWGSKFGFGLYYPTSEGFSLDLSLNYYHGIGENEYFDSSIRLEGGLKIFLFSEGGKDEFDGLKKGDWLFSAMDVTAAPGEVLGIGYSNSYDLFGIQLHPTIGYMMSKTWLVGSGFNLGAGSYDDFSINSWTASPFVRFYLPKESSRWQFFPEIGLSYQRYSIYYDVAGQPDYKTSKVNGSFALGTNYFLSQNVALEGKLVLLPGSIIQLNFGLQTFISGK